ncbi:MAG: aldo/keto reductase [Desulfobacterales bacterium]|nr:MAG: aldo/keto reductase [Desulfobacterales bacterium]
MIGRNNHAAFPRIELRPGYSVSRVLKGGWQLAGGHGTVHEQQALEDMKAFVEAGITTFDCADIYTGVEALIGKFLRCHAGQFRSGTLPPVQIHTKCVPDLALLPNLTRAHTESIIDRSLKRLGVERLDLVQFHWWDFTIPGFHNFARHLDDIQKSGKIRYLGATNIDARHLGKILEMGIPVVSNQVQYSVLDRRPEKDLEALCRENDLMLLSYGSIAGGFLTEKYLGVTEPQEPFENRSLTKYKLIIDDFGGWDLFQELLKCLKRIADKYQVGIAEVSARYVMQKPFVAGVIIGARHSRHLEKIKKISQFQLDAEDLKTIAQIVDQSTGPVGSVYELERDRDSKHGRIMRYNLSSLE